MMALLVALVVLVAALGLGWWLGAVLPATAATLATLAALVLADAMLRRWPRSGAGEPEPLNLRATGGLLALVLGLGWLGEVLPVGHVGQVSSLTLALQVVLVWRLISSWEAVRAGERRSRPARSEALRASRDAPPGELRGDRIHGVSELMHVEHRHEPHNQAQGAESVFAQRAAGEVAELKGRPSA